MRKTTFRRKYNRRKRRSATKRAYKRRMRGGATDIPDMGFIMTRCVKKPEYNRLYKECYRRIRERYPTMKIVIIDDNSDKSALEDFPMENVEIIQSEFPGAAEYLPYYYMLTRRLFKRAVFIQDSMFLNGMIDFNSIKDYKFLYYFDEENKSDKNYGPTLITQINSLNQKDRLMEMYKAGGWVSCWGSAMGITLEFLERLEKELSITNLKTIINDRDNRIALEHLVGLCCMFLSPKPINEVSFFGSFTTSQMRRDPEINGLYNYDMYEKDKGRVKESIIKLWNRR